MLLNMRQNLKYAEVLEWVEGVSAPPPPLEFQNIHLREQHFQRSTILQIALEVSRSCIVHINVLSALVTEQPNLRHIIK